MQEPRKAPQGFAAQGSVAGSAPGDAASARAVRDPPRSSPPPARFPGALAAALRLLLQVCHSHGGKNNRFSGSPMKPRGFANTLRLFSHWKHRDDPMGATNAEERPRRDAESQESSGGVAGPGRRPVLPLHLAPAGGSRGKGGRRGASASASRPLATAARSAVSRGRGRAVQSPPRKLLSLGYLSIRQETEC